MTLRRRPLRGGLAPRAFGAVADWLHRTAAGLGPAAPGYRRVAIRPLPGAALTHAHARHETPYGMAETGWRIVDGALQVRAVVPPNTTAEVTLPGRTPFEVGSGFHRWAILMPGSMGSRAESHLETARPV